MRATNDDDDGADSDGDGCCFDAGAGRCCRFGRDARWNRLDRRGDCARPACQIRRRSGCCSDVAPL